jgi:hypothetical protein
LNLRLSGPKPDALTRLRHAPHLLYISSFRLRRKEHGRASHLLKLGNAIRRGMGKMPVPRKLEN